MSMNSYQAILACVDLQNLHCLLMFPRSEQTVSYYSQVSVVKFSFDELTGTMADGVATDLVAVHLQFIIKT